MNTMTRSNPIRCTLAVTVIGAFALGVGTITAAADDLAVPQATIRFGDLNLASPQGAKVLYERIVSASYIVCQPFDRDRNDQPAPFAAQACQRKLIADAVTKIGKPALYAAYNNRNATRLLAPIAIAESRK